MNLPKKAPYPLGFFFCFCLSSCTVEPLYTKKKRHDLSRGFIIPLTEEKMKNLQCFIKGGEKNHKKNLPLMFFSQYSPLISMKLSWPIQGSHQPHHEGRALSFLKQEDYLPSGYSRSFQDKSYNFSQENHKTSRKFSQKIHQRIFYDFYQKIFFHFGLSSSEKKNPQDINIYDPDSYWLYIFLDMETTPGAMGTYGGAQILLRFLRVFYVLVKPQSIEVLRVLSQGSFTFSSLEPLSLKNYYAHSTFESFISDVLVNQCVEHLGHLASQELAKESSEKLSTKTKGDKG